LMYVGDSIERNRLDMQMAGLHRMVGGEPGRAPADRGGRTVRGRVRVAEADAECRGIRPPSAKRKLWPIRAASREKRSPPFHGDA
jgi:hypothetical protein